MSIDLFFVAAPFLCRDGRELETLRKRIVFAIAVAGVCFLFFPLRFAFERPQASDWLGAIFNWFRAMDQPYNLLPSLHITLRTILAYHYARRATGILRITSHAWFSLIGVSTLLTYQHHVMDVVGGFVLAGYCFYAFRESPAKLAVTPNHSVGSYYAAGTLTALGLAIIFWPWGSLLLWPALALGIVASAYFGVGPGIFRKRDGRLHWTGIATRHGLHPLQKRVLAQRRRRRRASANERPGCQRRGSLGHAAQGSPFHRRAAGSNLRAEGICPRRARALVNEP